MIPLGRRHPFILPLLPIMADFVRLHIFGTTFEITTRYADLQPVGMGAFGLVWYASGTPLFLSSHNHPPALPPPPLLLLLLPSRFRPLH